MPFIVTRDEIFPFLLDYVGEFEADYDLDAVFAELDDRFHLTGHTDQPSWRAARQSWSDIPTDELDAILAKYDRTLIEEDSDVAR
jgi:hypothetical protein